MRAARAARNVDSHDEFGVAALGKPTTSLIDRSVEADGGTLGEECCLDRLELVGLHGFTDGNNIRFRHMAEILLEKPDAHPCMALREEDDRV